MTLSGAFAFEKTGEKLLVGASGITAFLGTGYGTADEMGVKIQNANLGLVLYANKTYALDASAAAMLVGFEGILTLTGTLGVRVNNTGKAVSESVNVNGTAVPIVFSAAQGNIMGFSGSVALEIAGFVTLSGAFAFEKSGVGASQKILVGASGINAFLGTGYGTADEMGVKIQNANLGLVLYANKTYALDASAAAMLVGFEGILTLTGTLGVRVNNTGVAVNESVNVNGTAVPIVFSAAQGNIMGFSGSVALEIAGFVTLSGAFAFEKSGVGASQKILVGASGINAFLGTGYGTADEMGVKIQNANLGLVLYANKTYALDASAAAMLVGFEGILTLTGTLGVRVNNTGKAVSESVNVNGTAVPIVFSAAQGNIMGFSGSVALEIAGFVTLSGAFAFEKSGVGAAQKILVGASGINAFLGTGYGTADEMGVKIQNANLGLVLYANKTYALDASAAAMLVGFEGILTLTGTLGVRVNKTGVAVNESVNVNGTAVPIVFSAAQGNIMGFSGSVALEIAGFVTLSGAFAFEKSGVGASQKILVGASGINAFLGTGYGTADEMGVKIQNANLGLVLYANKTYALDASAAAMLVGFEGILTLTGTLGVRVNNTGGAVNESVNVNGTAVPIVFSAAQGNIMGFSGSVALEIAGFVTLSGSFAFEKSGVGASQKILVGASGINAFLGTGYGTADEMGVKIQNANLGLVLFANKTYALDASAAALLVGFEGILTLTGTLGVRVNNTGKAVSESVNVNGTAVPIVFSAAQGNIMGFSGSVALEIAGFVTLSGAFAFEKSGIGAAQKILVGASGINAFLGTGYGTADEMGVKIQNANLGLVLYANKTYALDASAAAMLVGFEGILTLTGTLGVRVNNTGKAVSESVNVNGTAVPIVFSAAQGNIMGFSGSVALEIAGFVTLSGAFAFEKSGIGAAQKILVGASGINAFLGTGYGTADEMGVKIQNANLGLVLYANKTYALDASAAAMLVGFEGILTLTGTLGVRVNNTGGAVNESVNVNGTAVPIVFTASQGNVMGFSGSVALEIADFVKISGNFGFTKSGTGTATKLLVGAAGITTFFGTADESMGVRIRDAGFGLVLLKVGGVNKYAVTATGTAELVGFEGVLQLVGTLAVKVNNTGTAIHESIDVGLADPVLINFDTGAVVQGIYGSITLQIVDFVAISGSFGFEKQITGSITKMLIGASNINIFLGTGAGTADAIGLQVTNANLGVVLFKEGTAAATYALSADGSAALVGLDGLQISGTLGVKINQTGKIVNETVHTLTQDIPVKFTSADKIQIFSGSITLTVTGIFTLTGSITATIKANGTVLIDIPDVSLSISLNGSEVFAISAAARFSISKVDGFKMLDMRMTGFSIMGYAGDPTPNYQGNALSIFNTTLQTVTVPAAGSKPDANLDFPTNGGQIDASILNTRKYIDITYNDYSGQGLDLASITDLAAEFTITGTGLGDAQLDLVEQLDANTFRYHFIDKNTANTINLFQAGIVQIVFTTGSWADKSGKTNASETESFTVVVGSAAATKPINLGPLALEGPSLSITDFKFKMLKDADGKLIGPSLSLMIGIALAKASFNFGTSQNASGVKAELTGLLGAFELVVNLDIHNLFAMPDISATGKFKISVDSLSVVVPNAVSVAGTSILITYDPNGLPSQEIVRVTSLTVKIIPLDLQGALVPFTRTNGTTIPGLSIRGDGFQLGTASLQYTGELNFGTIMKIKGIKAGVSDFGLTFGQNLVFNGEVFIAADYASLFPGSTFAITITDGPDAGTEAVWAALTFSNGVPDGFKFRADQLSFEFAGVITVKGSNIYINTNAGPTEEVASFVSLGASISAGPLQVTGEMRNFAFLGDGSFKTKTGFGVFVSADALTGESVGWPSWMPIRITQIGIEWRDIQADPTDFVLTLSAAVTGMYNLPFEFSGGIDGIKIDLGLLKQGKFPIIALNGISVGIKGQVFGGTLEGGLVGGILRIDSNYNMIADTDSTTPVFDRVFYMGVQGGFIMPGIGGGFTIKFALSELGPLGVAFSLSIPGGIIIEPNTGIALNDFAGGVEFFKSLPSLTNPSDLRTIVLPTSNTSVVNWADSIKLQVVAQYKSIKNNPNQAGFLAAFTAPMIISGSASLFDAYVSEATIKGNVTIMISTDGKFFIKGKLLFGNGAITIAASLYADISKIARGSATVLFLADLPEQARFMVVAGKFQMGFNDPSGNPVTFTTVDPSATPYANLASPTNQSTISLNALNNVTTEDPDRHINIEFLPSTGSEIDATSINGDEINLIAPDGSTITLGTPTLVTGTISTYRYNLPAALVAGDYQVRILANSFTDKKGIANLAETETFTLSNPTATLAGPTNGKTVSKSTFDPNNYVIIRFVLAEGASLDESSMDLAKFHVAGQGAGTATGFTAYTKVDETTYQFALNGTISTGTLNVTMDASAFKDSYGTVSKASAESFIIYSTTATLKDPVSGSTIDVATLNLRHYIDINFIPVPGAYIDGSVINGDEITLDGSAKNNVQLTGVATFVADNVYRFTFTGSFIPGSVTVNYVSGSWTDSAGNTNTAFSQTYTAAGTTAALANKLEKGLAGLSVINTDGYIEIRFKPTSGASLLYTSISDPDLEISIRKEGGAANITGVTFDSCDNTTGICRYNVTGSFTNGNVTIDIAGNSFGDDATYTNLASTLYFTLASPTADLYKPAIQDTMNYTALGNPGLYLCQVQRSHRQRN